MLNFDIINENSFLPRTFSNNNLSSGNRIMIQKYNKKLCTQLNIHLMNAFFK